MSPHTLSEPTIVETSETELISGTESYSSSDVHRKEVIDTNESMDSLFAQLQNETKKISSDSLSLEGIEEDDDEFKKIRKSINKLPKIESNLESKLGSAAITSNKSHDITRINDPITSKMAVAKEDNNAGSKWFNMKQPEMTGEIKRDLLVIKQRAALDPKRHYKKDKWQIPKYFEMGTIIEGNTEFYSSRMKKKERGNTLVEEVLNDQDAKKYFKRKYGEIQVLKTSGRKGHYKKVKEMRKKY